MLVLARNLGEILMIGHDIEITVLEIKPTKVRLGIEAPKEVDVHRKEIYTKNLARFEIERIKQGLE